MDHSDIPGDDVGSTGNRIPTFRGNVLTPPKGQ